MRMFPGTKATNIEIPTIVLLWSIKYVRQSVTIDRNRKCVVR